MLCKDFEKGLERKFERGEVKVIDNTAKEWATHLSKALKSYLSVGSDPAKAWKQVQLELKRLTSLQQQPVRPFFVLHIFPRPS